MSAGGAAAAGFGTLPPGAGLAAFFLLGLLGGAHCLGMCGPLVTMYADRMPAGERERGPSWYELRQHGLFNAGRTVSYAAVGIVMGALGAATYGVADFAAVGDAVRAVTGVAVGALVVAVGAGYLTRGSATGAALSLPVLGGAFARVHDVLTDRVESWARGPRIVGLGVVHGFLPCPLLYPAFLWAFAQGSPVRGGFALAALGLGTFPTLFAYGTAFGSLDTATRRRLHRALGAVFVLLGTVPLAHGLALAGVSVPHVPLPMP